MVATELDIRIVLHRNFTMELLLFVNILLCAMVAFLLAPAAVDGFSAGVPDRSCSSMVAEHGAKPQTSDPPFNIQPSVRTYRPGETMEVTVSGQGSKRSGASSCRLGAVPAAVRPWAPSPSHCPTYVPITNKLDH